MDYYNSNDLFVIADILNRTSTTWRHNGHWTDLLRDDYEKSLIGYEPYDAYLVSCWLNSSPSIKDMLWSGQTDFYYCLTDEEMERYMSRYIDDEETNK